MQPQFIPLPAKAKDITGQRFGRLVALGPIGRLERNIVWLCRCDCGNTTTVRLRALQSKNTQSCGCFQKDRTSKRFTKHGMWQSRLYSNWCAMIQRCTNPEHAAYSSYGGRGIAVCDEWQQSFEIFYADLSTLPDFGREGYTLDRIDNSLGYKPSNVRWATKKEQARNSRKNHLVTFDGKTQPLAIWAEELGLRPGTLWNRLNRGWSLERALTALRK